MTLSSTPVRRILADTFESASGVPDGLRLSGVLVEVSALPAGDYDLGDGVIVERKTVADLHMSLERGRLWGQLGKLRAQARLPYLLVEGGDLDEGSLAPAAIRGACLGVIGQGIPLIRSEGSADSALCSGSSPRASAEPVPDEIDPRTRSG